MSIKHMHDTNCPYCDHLNTHNYYCEEQKPYLIQFVSCKHCNNSYAVSIIFTSNIAAIWKLELATNFIKDD
jgi:transcription elongation factor Elf1